MVRVRTTSRGPGAQCQYKKIGNLSAPYFDMTTTCNNMEIIIFVCFSLHAVNQALHRLTKHEKKLVGGRISALPTRPVLNTVQFTSLLELQGSYDCTLPLLPDTFPLEDTRIFSHSLETSRRQFQIVLLVLPRP